MDLTSIRQFTSVPVQPVKISQEEVPGAEAPQESFTHAAESSSGTMNPKKVASLAATAAAMFSEKPGFTVKWTKDLQPPEGINDFVTGIVEPIVREDGIFLNAFGVTRKFDFDGEEKWQKTTSFTHHKPVTFGPDGCLYQPGDKDLMKITSSGDEEWTRPTGAGSPKDKPVIKGDRIYTSDSGGTVTCFNKDGSVEWCASLQDARWGIPAVDGAGRVIMVGDKGKDGTYPYLVLDPANRRKDGSVEPKVLGNYPDTPFHVGDNGTIYTVIANQLAALGKDGKPMWNLPFPKSEFKDIGVTVHVKTGSDGNLYIRSCGATREDSAIYCMKPDGTPLWDISGHESYMCNFVWDSEGTVYFSSCSSQEKPGGGKEQINTLIAVEPNGHVKWRAPFRSDALKPQLFLGAGDVLFAGGENEPFRSFDTKNGTLLFESEPLSGIEGYGIDRDNNIYAAVKVKTTGDDRKRSLVKLEYTSSEELVEKVAEKIEQAQQEDPQALPVSKEGENVDIGGALLKKRKRKI